MCAAFPLLLLWSCRLNDIFTSRFLPSLSGRFAVGVTTFVTPIRPPRTIGSVKLKRPENGRPNGLDHALVLEEIAFTAYYPAEVNGISTWLLWPVVYFFGQFIKIPAYPNAPLLEPSKTDNNPEQEGARRQWPLVIFSHGLGGSRTAYSHFCSNVAASGRVVLAVEHRDGTGTFVMPRCWNHEGRSESRTLFYLRERDIHFDDSDTIDSPMPLRGKQLAFRHQEIYTMYSVFKRFVNNESVDLHTIDESAFERSSWLPGPAGAPKVQCDNDVVLSGHSFGACTVLSILSTKPLEGHPVIPVDRALILDPWLEPLPTPGPIPVSHKNGESADVNADTESVRTALEESLPASESSAKVEDTRHPRMMVINSETFTIWKDHFPRLQEIVARWEPKGGRIMTIVGSAHASFSDFFILPVVGKKSSRLILDRIMTLSLGYLDNRLDEALESVPKTKTNIEIIGVKKDGKPKRRLVGTLGDVIVQ